MLRFQVVQVHLVTCSVRCVEPLTASPRTGPSVPWVPAGTHWGDDPSSQDGGSSERQLVRVSCPLVVVVCLCVVLHAHV